MLIERALDLACGRGRHARWLARHGCKVVAVDLVPQTIPGVDFVQADLDRHEFRIEPASWDVIVCWLYWQPDLLPEISSGLCGGGVAALSGKTSGRFATCLGNYRAAFPGWEEIDAGETEQRAWFIARKPVRA